jgi:hypothetical protein
MMTIRMPCVDGAAAADFVAHLKAQEVDVTGIEGREVLIPSNHPAFAWDIATAAVEADCAHEHEAIAAARTFLANFPGLR